MYVNCGVRFEDGIQIVFSNIADFYAFEERRKAEGKEHPIRGLVKSINTEVVYIDEYSTGLYEWYVVGGKFLNGLEPLRWHPLENYIEAGNMEGMLRELSELENNLRQYMQKEDISKISDCIAALSDLRDRAYASYHEDREFYTPFERKVNMLAEEADSRIGTLRFFEEHEIEE